MDRERIEQLLDGLGARLARHGIAADIFIVGGAAMALAYSARRSTSDIDALIEPSDQVLAVAADMAEDLGLPRNWLSQGVVDTMHGLASDPDPVDWTELSGHTKVRVRVGSPRFLLAMKAMTTRRSTVDLEDAAVLCRWLGFTREEQIFEVVAEFWGSRDVGSQELFFEDIIERAAQLPSTSGDADAGTGRCGHWMPRAGRSCRLPRGHRGQHR